MQWEYRIDFFPDTSRPMPIELALNAFGKYGWELVNLEFQSDGIRSVMKRPISLPPLDELITIEGEHDRPQREKDGSEG